jgi:TonB family protein
LAGRGTERNIRRPTKKKSFNLGIIFLVLAVTIMVLFNYSVISEYIENILTSKEESLYVERLEENFKSQQIEIQALEVRLAEALERQEILDQSATNNSDVARGALQEKEEELLEARNRLESAERIIEDLMATTTTLRNEIEDLRNRSTSNSVVPIPPPSTDDISSANDLNDNIVIADSSSDPALLSRAVPEYPRRALQRGLEGSAAVMFDLDKRGVPFNVRVSESTSSIFNGAAISATLKMRYNPATDAIGRPVIFRGLRTEYSWVLDE